jgi:hypothetical protein
MNLLTNQKLWNAVLKTPPVKWMLKTTLKKCPKCNRTPLETALDNYAGKNHLKCSSCNLYARVIGFWIDFIQKALAAEKSRVFKLFAVSTVPYKFMLPSFWYGTSHTNATSTVNTVTWTPETFPR